MASTMTDARIVTAAAMLVMARRARDPFVRAQILAETEYQVAWAFLAGHSPLAQLDTVDEARW